MTFSDTRPLTMKELSECPCIEMTSQYPLGPQFVKFPSSSLTVQEDIGMQKTVDAISSNTNLGNDESDEVQTQSVVFDIDDMSSRINSSTKVTEIPREIDQLEIQDVSINQLTY